MQKLPIDNTIQRIENQIKANKYNPNVDLDKAHRLLERAKIIRANIIAKQNK